METELGDWFKKLITSKGELEYILNLLNTIEEERERYLIYPEKDDIFKALTLTQLKDTKVLILGQDPYHTPDVADGLAFSSKKEKYCPPSLLNIFKEIQTELYPKKELIDIFPSNSLVSWAKQGVLLLNTCLTVRKGKPNSHAYISKENVGIGWERITEKILNTLLLLDSLVVISWGKSAQKITNKVLKKNKKENWLFLESAHPSPYSFSKFKNNNHFKLTNEFLLKPINWSTNEKYN